MLLKDESINLIFILDNHFPRSSSLLVLMKKQNSRSGIRHFYEQDATTRQAVIKELNVITTQILEVEKLEDFESLLLKHEQIIATHLQLERAQDLYFGDYWGAVKSLGAWGGDFVLVTSNRAKEETITYFRERGFEVVLGYREMVK